MIPNNRLKTYGDRLISVAATELWNGVPLNLRKSTSYISRLTSSETPCIEMVILILNKLVVDVKYMK